MGKNSARVIALLVCLGGCIDSSSVQCGFGLCPEGSTCDETAKTCIPAGCGDGVVTGAEECDGTVPAGFNCTSFGFYAPAGLACSSSCKLDTSACGAVCGDHVINGPELCDGIPPVAQSCSDYGFSIGRLGCSVECAPSFQQCQSIGWTNAIGNANDDLLAIWGASPDAMWGVGGGGSILVSSGGIWQLATSPTTADLTGVWGASATDIFAVGSAGTIVHYDGTAWSVVSSPTTKALHAINGHVAAGQVQIWAVGDGGTILTTTYPVGGSASWAAQPSGVTVALRGVWAENTMFAIAVGDATTAGTAAPTALRLEFATQTWAPVTTPTILQNGTSTAGLYAVWGSDVGFVAAGTHGAVLQYNGASSTNPFVYTGQQLVTDDLHAIWGVVSLDPVDPAKFRTDIFIGGDAGDALHYDAIVQAPFPNPHFDRFELHTTLAVNALWGTGPAFARAAMGGGGVMEYDGTDFSSAAVVPSGVKLAGIWHDPVANIAIAVGGIGTVVRRDFTGWSAPMTVGSAADGWVAVLGFGSTVFIAGGAGIAMSTTSGAAWNAPTLGTDNFHGLWGLSSNSVWAVGNANNGGPPVVFHYNGSTWTAAAAPGAATTLLRSIWGTSDSDIFVVGSNGQIFHFDGMAWTPMTSGVSGVILNDVWGDASNDVFVVGGNGTILHYDGAAWHRMTSNTGSDLSSVGGTGHGDVFAGGRGVLYHFTGVSWAPMEPATEDVYGMWVEKQDTFFAGVGAVSRLRRTQLAAETRCGDPWDNDYDGLTDCADSDCYSTTDPDLGCGAGGTCAPATPIDCGYIAPADADTYTGTARIDDLPCLDHATAGPEASYRMVADHDGPIVVTLDDPAGRLDLVELDPFDATRLACDVGHCTSAPETGDRSITIQGKQGGVYYFVVDGPAATAEGYGLSVTCP